jgi:UDP-N-acetylglucosamine:LPS N-acetylglucosamine transferase
MRKLRDKVLELAQDREQRERMAQAAQQLRM